MRYAYRRAFIVLTLSWLLAAPAVPSSDAREYAPRVVSPHNADAYSMKTFRRYHRWRDLEGDRLAWEVYRYLVDRRTGVFHMNRVLEGGDVLSEHRTVRDPVKIINGYGYGYCGIFGPVMAGVWQDRGLGKARTLVLPAWNHVASEVFYDGRWHYLDVDVRAAFRRADRHRALALQRPSGGAARATRPPGVRSLRGRSGGQQLPRVRPLS